MDAQDDTRNGAREKPVMYAYAFLVGHAMGKKIYFFYGS